MVLRPTSFSHLGDSVSTDTWPRVGFKVEKFVHIKKFSLYMTLKHIKCLDLYQCQGFLPLPSGSRDFMGGIRIRKSLLAACSFCQPRSISITLYCRTRAEKLTTTQSNLPSKKSKSNAETVVLWRIFLIWTLASLIPNLAWWSNSLFTWTCT